MTTRKQTDTISPRLIQTICQRLTANKRVRRTLPLRGRIHIDRQLPFLCVYRRPAEREDAGTSRLASSEASYLICSGQRNQQSGNRDLVRAVTKTLAEQFGAFLIVELWSAPLPTVAQPLSTELLVPRFQILTRSPSRGESLFADKFKETLSRIRIGRKPAEVTVRAAARCAPPAMVPLLTADELAQSDCQLLGLEIAPIYCDPVTGALFPAVLAELRRRLTRALRRSFFDFARQRTTHQPPHYHALGRQAMVKAVWEVDRLLAASSDRFDFLLQVTPVNTDAAWQEFRRGSFQCPPVFHYRPLPIEPVILKRELYKTPVERVEDPALAQLFGEKLDELDRQITMLQDLTTPRFVHGSAQLYGEVDGELLQLARNLLDCLPARTRDDASAVSLGADAFARRAEEEFQYYRQQLPTFQATVQLRDDIASLMVSRGSLLVCRNTQIPESRVEPLLQHEVGTHILTYHNGRSQRFHQLYTGLAGYDTLQEGLAVLSEYLVGGLSRPRLRLLAARVVAVSLMLSGATFVDTFRELDRLYDFARRTAFIITARVFRGGGLTKDAIYLKGLTQILEYLSKGGELDPLFVGKIAIQHVPLIRELEWRGVLRKPPLRPRYMMSDSAAARFARLRAGMSVLDLIERR